MTARICREPDPTHPDDWFERATYRDTIRFPGVDCCLAMAFPMANDSMLGAHTGVFRDGHNEVGNDCAGKMPKTMLDSLHVGDGKIAEFLMITDLPRASDLLLRVGGGGDFAGEGSFFFDTCARIGQLRQKRQEAIDVCIFDKVTGAGDIELDGNADKATIRRGHRSVLAKNFSKLQAGTTTIPP